MPRTYALTASAVQQSFAYKRADSYFPAGRNHICAYFTNTVTAMVKTANLGGTAKDVVVAKVAVSRYMRSSSTVSKY